VISCIERGVGRVTRVLLDNMVVRMPNGDVDVSMLQSAVDLVNSRFETEVRAFIQPWVGFFGGKTINSEGRVFGIIERVGAYSFMWCFFFGRMQASGNVTIETVGRIGSTGVTYISRYRNKKLNQPHY